MCDVQALIDRQLGHYSRFNYDNILKRFIVRSTESFYGLRNDNEPAGFDHDTPIFACRFAETSGYEHILALANENGRVALQTTYKANDGNARTIDGFQCHYNAVFDLVWMPGSMKFVTVSGDHTVILWDVGDGVPRREHQFAGHTRSVKTAAFPPRSASLFATGARDGHVLVWDPRADAAEPVLALRTCHPPLAPPAPPGRRRVLVYPPASVTGLAFRDDVSLLSCGECDGNVKAWDLRRGHSTHRRTPLPAHVLPYPGVSAKRGYTSLLVDECGVRLYASCMDDAVYCYNVAAHKTRPERAYRGHENATFYIKTCLSPDGEYLVSGSSDGYAYVWNVRRSEPVVRLAGHRAEVTCAAWRRRGEAELVTCSDDAYHKIWRIGGEGETAVEGRAEPAPRLPEPARPLWGSCDVTHHRKSAASKPASAKRSLVQMFSAAMGEECAARKRLRLHATASPSPAGPSRLTPTEGPALPDPPSAALADFSHLTPTTSPAGPSHLTPTKELPTASPAGLSLMSPNKGTTLPEPPSHLSPTKRRALPESPSHLTPTKRRAPPELSSPRRSPRLSPRAPRSLTANLPNYVANGEAPHLRLMSPPKRRRETADWLTRMVQERRVSLPVPAPTLTVAKEGPHRRNSISSSPKGSSPKCSPKTPTLLKYFYVTPKEKPK